MKDSGNSQKFFMKKLSDLKNVGKATLEDLRILDIHTVDELAHQDPTILFHELEKRSKKNKIPASGMCLLPSFMKQLPENPPIGGSGQISAKPFKKMASCII